MDAGPSEPVSLLFLRLSVLSSGAAAGHTGLILRIMISKQVVFMSKGMDKNKSYLFGDGPDYDSQAVIDMGFFAEYAYIEGFKDAARVICDSVKSGEQYADTMVYPAVYCYRHYFELSLKRVIRLGYELDILANLPDALKGHNLASLWHHAKEVIQKVVTDESINVLLKRIETRINEFHKFDPNGEAFRYSTRKDGVRSLPEDAYRINLVVFREAMDDIADAIDGVMAYMEEALENYSDYKSELIEQERAFMAEYEEEMRAEYEADMRDLYRE